MRYNIGRKMIILRSEVLGWAEGVYVVWSIPKIWGTDMNVELFLFLRILNDVGHAVVCFQILPSSSIKCSTTKFCF